MKITEFVDTTMKVISYIIDHDYSDGGKYVPDNNEYGFIRRKEEFNICKLELTKDGLAINEKPQFYGSTLYDINYTGNKETESILISPAYIIKLLFQNYEDNDLTHTFLSEHPEIDNKEELFEMDTIDKIIYKNNLTEADLKKYNFSYSKLYQLLCELREENMKGDIQNGSEIKDELAKIPKINGSILLSEIKSLDDLTPEQLSNLRLISPLIAKKIEIMYEFEKTLYESYEKGLHFVAKEMYYDDLITEKKAKEMMKNSDEQQFSFGWFATLINLGVDEIILAQDKAYESSLNRGKITRLGFDKSVIPGNVKQYIKTLSE